MLRVIFRLESLAWELHADVEGLDDATAEIIRARWPRADAEPDRANGWVHLDAIDQDVGLPSGDVVNAVVTWTSDRAASLETNGAELDVELADTAIRATGRVRAQKCLGTLESIFRSLAVIELARQRVVVLHASAVRHGDVAVLFLGASGAGKTTTARRLGRRGFTRIADDMIALDLAHDPPLVHALPFERKGRGSPASNASPPRCAGALVVDKGARDASIDDRVDRPRELASALIALAPPLGREAKALDRFEALCGVRVARFAAPPSGAIDEPIVAWLRDGHGTRRPKTRAADSESMAHALDPRGISRAPNVAWRIIDGAAVLVAPNSPAIQTLNPVGTLVWELADGRAIDVIIDEVVNEFEVSRTQAEQDVELFVSDLHKRGLLLRGEGAAG